MDPKLEHLTDEEAYAQEKFEEEDVEDFEASKDEEYIFLSSFGFILVH